MISGVAGIYQFKNMKTGRFYIGSTMDLANRKSDHYFKAKNNRHNNPKIQKDFLKYGREAFKFFVLERIVEPDLLEEREQFWINKFNKKCLYNICVDIGIRKRTSKSNHPNAGQGFGRKLPKETCLKMSAYRTGRPMSDQARKNMSAARIGIVFSKTHRAKLGAWQKGITKAERIQRGILRRNKHG